jgi:hypothetical protein
MLAEGATLAAVVLLLAVSAVLLAASWVMFQRRDLR